VLLGTIQYMSPEQALGKSVDHRSDIFSFGIVLYQMAARRRPFGGASAIETIDKIIHAEPEDLSAAEGDIPRGLQPIVRRCLEKDRERRYQSTHELVEDLKKARRDLDTQRLTGILPAPAPVPVPAPKGTLRRVVYSSVAVLAAVVVAVALYVSMWQEKQPAAAAPAAVAPKARLSDGAPPSSNPEANEYYEKALLWLRTRADLPRAVEMLDRALQLDPHFAEARAYHALCQFITVDAGYSNDAGLLYKTEEETRRALDDNPRSAVARATRAAVLLYQGRKDLVPGEVKAALDVDPGSANAKVWLMNYHQLNGDYAAAEALATEILRDSPLEFPARMNLADFRRQQGDFAGAIRQLDKILEQDPQNLFALVKLARAYGEQGDLNRARIALEAVRPEDRRNFQVRLEWAVQLALKGRRQQALKEMDADVLKYATLVPHLTSRVAEFYATLKDAPKALEWLDVALRNGDERAEWFSRDPLLASIRNEPRFKQILDSIALRRQSRARAAGPQ
jgi:tetratricopeptide (TPR) repeat protein